MDFEDLEKYLDEIEQHILESQDEIIVTDDKFVNNVWLITDNDESTNCEPAERTVQ